MAFLSGGTRKGSRYHRLDDIPVNTFTPRTYQIQLLDSSLKRNTLLCLGSHESKVFLALMVAKEKATETRVPLHSGGKRTFYLADAEEELEFLCQTLPNHTDLSVYAMTSGTDSDDEDERWATWRKNVESNNIIVSLGSVFLQALSKGCIRVEDTNLLIFDDCHKSVETKDHPYEKIVSEVKTVPLHAQPLLLGLTAAIAGTECSDPESLKETISQMEKTMNAYAETSMLILSERFGCRPSESIIPCEEADDDTQTELKDLMESILQEPYDFFLNCCIPIDDQVDNRNPCVTPLQVLRECLNILEVLGSWCTSSIAEYFVMQLDKIIKCEKNDIHKKFLRCVTTTLRRLTKEFEINFHPDYDVDELLEYTTAKVRELVKVLRKYKPEVDFMIISNNDLFDNDDDMSDLSDEEEDDDDASIVSGSDGESDGRGSPGRKSSAKPMHIAVKRTADGGHERIMTFSEEEEKNLCGVVFVENRYIAFGLSKVVEEVCSWDENLCFVKTCHITGQGLKSGGSASKQRGNKSYKRQEEALRKFRTQECNLMIATRELEEGVDIPKCNLVVRFDPPRDYRSYALSKGRARARDSSFVILLDDEDLHNFNSSVGIFKEIEKVLLGDSRANGQGRFCSGDDSDADDEAEEEEIESDLDEVLPPPYCTTSGATVSMETAIALINRYCAKLPTDAFTHLTPQCRVEKLDKGSYVAYLRLPINSPVKEELKGPAMRTKKLAKKAVALEMCKILHCNGELDDKLVPVGKEMFLYEEEEEQDEDEEELSLQVRPGTTKRKQYYIKKVADAFVHCHPRPDEPCFLYLINLVLTGPITDEQNTRGRVIYAPEDTHRSLGILLSKEIPQMPHFPVYTRSGEVTASLDLLKRDVVFTKEEISNLLQFHQFVFSDVLHLIKDPMEFAPEVAEYGCFIVPLDGEDSLDVEWDFVQKVIEFAQTEKQKAGVVKGKSSPEPFHFSVDDFKDAVVMPSYRNIDQPQHFYVAEIRHDLNPLSPFPSPELYKTFKDYYTTKYGLKITSTDQPLLDVDHTSARLNLLTPRYMNQKGVALPTSSAETKRARRENLQQKQILVPELCGVHVFPASLWRKTVCLPTILYRANCLLLAEELRRKISRETGIGMENLPPGFNFSKLDFGFETNPEKLKEVGNTSANSENTSSDNIQDGDTNSSEGQETENASTNSDKLNSDNVQSCKQQEEIKKVNGEDSKYSSLKESCVPMDTASDDQDDSSVVHDGQRQAMDKTDSSASSDSDSGIASSCSDTNLGREEKFRIISGISSDLGVTNSIQESCADEPNSKMTADGSAKIIPKFSAEKKNEMALDNIVDRVSTASDALIDSKSAKVSTYLVTTQCSVEADHSLCNFSLNGDHSAPATQQQGSSNQCNNVYTNHNIAQDLSSHEPLQGSSARTISTSGVTENSSSTTATISTHCTAQRAGTVNSESLSPNSSHANLPSNLQSCAMSAASSTFSTAKLPSDSVGCDENCSCDCKPVTDSGAINSQNSMPCDPSLSSLSQSQLLQCTDLYSKQRTTDQDASESLVSSSLSSPCVSNGSTVTQSDLRHTCSHVVTDKSPISPATHFDQSAHDECDKMCSSNSFVTDISMNLPSEIQHKLTISSKAPIEYNGCDVPIVGQGLDPEVSNTAESITALPVNAIISPKESPLLPTTASPIVPQPSNNCDNDHLLFHHHQDCVPDLNHKPYVHQSKIISHDSQCNDDLNPKSQEDTIIISKDGSQYDDSPLKETPMTSTTRASTSTRNEDKALTSEPVEPAIVMNTLEEELRGLQIDLLCPLTTMTSDTFQYSSEPEWGQGGKPPQPHSDKVKSKDLKKEKLNQNSSTGNNEQFGNNSTDSTQDSSKGPNAFEMPFFKETDKLSDADLIKYSFDADLPTSKSEPTSELNIDSWSSETPDSSRDGNKAKPEKAAPSSKQEKTKKEGNKVLKPKVKDFDIGVWNCGQRKTPRYEYNPLKMHHVIQETPSNSPVSFLDHDAHSETRSNSKSLVLNSDDKPGWENDPLQLGPSPCLLLQALTMSNANDFFSLERLETIGDSFLKYAITVYLYCSYPGIHEGKLSYLRSKQVSNYNLYRLGRRKNLAEIMVSTKFEPYENWLPPGFIINEDRRRGPVPKVVIVSQGSKVNNASRNFYIDENTETDQSSDCVNLFNEELEQLQQSQALDQQADLSLDSNQTTLTPYSLQCHHGLPDKSLADCVEALIGCYLTTCGRKAALVFMSWLGLKVLPKKRIVPGATNRKQAKMLEEKEKSGEKNEDNEVTSWWQISEQQFDELRCPPSPMFAASKESHAQLEHLLEGFDELENKLGYHFRDRSYLLQAFTHASYHYNTITDCYQRVEFLGDAILDYVITRHLYEDSQKYSPGILTDLRSALVNNNIFAALAVKWGFHKYFKAISPSLFSVIDKFVKAQAEKNQDDIDVDEEFRELEEGESEEVNEDDDDDEEVEMEIPKALGDIFESVAGAIYLDSGMSLDAVWKVYYRMMKPHIDKYLKSIPKSPVRELLETEPETAKFERPERTMNGKVRVTVNVVGKGVYSGVGRNYRIAKSAAAKKALRSIRLLAQNLASA